MRASRLPTILAPMPVLALAELYGGGPGKAE
jgi:hypothetical protein